ncbi:MAG: GCN5-like protein N-acetyltransferase [candidate division TM6 bacterium GW2011_GWF2_32_72]|nr:MAG: GCN5-like protein N-acetyltransferase [candidate division TM6 bacterium GW2011_GWF2_32_72]
MSKKFLIATFLLGIAVYFIGQYFFKNVSKSFFCIAEKKVEFNLIFKPVEEKDLSLLYTWFQKPHVVEWWPVPKKEEDFFNSFLKRIRDGVVPYIVLSDNRPIGYIQSYDIAQSKKHAWLPPLPGKIIGIDQFIGEPDCLGKGIGTLFIKKFVKNLIDKNNDITVIVDPEPNNFAAIRCYEKVGFKKFGEYTTPWGPALLMIYEVGNPD